MVQIVKTHDPADFLAMVPDLVGMECRQSIVMVAFRGRRTCGAMRLDLPQSSSPTARKRFVTFLLGTMCKFPGIDGVLPVILCDDSYGRGVMPPHADLAKAIARRFHDSGFSVLDAICRAADGYASYLDDDNPVGGHPLSNIAESAARNALPGTALRDPRPARVADAPEAERERVAAEFARLRALVDSLRPRKPVPEELDDLEDLPGLMERVLRWTDGEVTERAALLLLAWQGPPTRDFSMLLWATDPTKAAGLFAAQAPPARSRFATVDNSRRNNWITDLMLGVGPRPDPDRLDAGIRIVLIVASLAHPERRPPLLCMLAWLHWALGRGTNAGRFIDEARSIDPSYGMAELLDTMLSNGLIPDWAFANDTGEAHDE